MNNETLIKQMKRAASCYFGEISPLFREAAAEIERLEQNNSKHMEVLGKLKETNDKYNKLIEENNRLQAAAKDRDEEIKDLEHILVGRNDTVDTVVKLNDEHIREKIRLKERVEELEQGVKEAVHANDDLIKRNLALVTENTRKAVERNNEVSKNARLDGKNLWLESEVKRLQAELDNLALAAHSDKSFPGYETAHIKPEELRDQFAIAALEGTLSAKGWHPEYIIPSGGGHVGGQRAADAAAESAYTYADAMMKAREK